MGAGEVFPTPLCNPIVGLVCPVSEGLLLYLLILGR